MIDVNSYFVGAGLMDLGLSNAGININQAFELDRDAVKTYRYNLGDHIKQCDLTEELDYFRSILHGLATISFG